MKCKDLMVGDLVYATDEINGETYVVPIESIGSDSITTRLGIHPEDTIRPVPITDDFLLHNGFVTDNDHTLTGSCVYHRLCGKYDDFKVTIRILNGWVKVESFDDKWYTLLNTSIQPRSVHEFQHLLRCCGLNGFVNSLTY